jgi:hypothetical protein
MPDLAIDVPDPTQHVPDLKTDVPDISDLAVNHCAYPYYKVRRLGVKFDESNSDWMNN